MIASQIARQNPTENLSPNHEERAFATGDTPVPRWRAKASASIGCAPQRGEQQMTTKNDDDESPTRIIVVYYREALFHYQNLSTCKTKPTPSLFRALFSG